MINIRSGSGRVGQLRAKGDGARDERRWKDAADFYASYLDHQPDDAAIWVQLGHCRKELGDREAAERAYLRALSMEPMNADTLVQIGHIEKLNGRIEQALSWYKKALLADPAFEPAKQEVDQVSRDLGAKPKPANSAQDTEAVISALGQRVGALADQVGAIKAVAVELQRVRKIVEALGERVSQVETTVSSQLRTYGAAQEAHAQRIASLETNAPGAQHSFPALLSHLADVNAQRAELERCRMRLEAVERHFNGTGH